MCRSFRSKHSPPILIFSAVICLFGSHGAFFVLASVSMSCGCDKHSTAFVGYLCLVACSNHPLFLLYDRQHHLFAFFLVPHSLHRTGEALTNGGLAFATAYYDRIVGTCLHGHCVSACSRLPCSLGVAVLCQHK